MMNSQSIPVDKVPDAVQNAERTRLRGPWLILARIGWLLISLSAVSLLITALVWNTRGWWNYTEAGCNGEIQHGKMAFERCIADFRAHEQVFGTMHVAALYYGLGAVVEMLPWVLVGLLIFWRNHMSLLRFFSRWAWS